MNNDGTLVIAPIRPFSDVDTFPSAYSNELKGGHHQVANLNDISTERLQDGMLATVVGISASTTYKYFNSTWDELSPDVESNNVKGGHHQVADLNDIPNDRLQEGMLATLIGISGVNTMMQYNNDVWEEFGGFVDIKDTYVTTSYKTENYTIINDTSTVVPVISISGGFDIMPNDNVENGVRFRVHDIGNLCGTYPVTISGGALGKINTDGGAIEFAMSSLGWTLIDKFENIFDRNEVTNEITSREGETLVANKFVTPSGGQGLEIRNTLNEVVAIIDENGKIQGRSGEFGLVGAEFTKTAQADFTNIGINVDQSVTDEFRNGYFDVGPSATLSVDTTWPNGTAKLTNGSYTTYDYTTSSSNVGITFDHGVGFTKSIVRYRHGGVEGSGTRSPKDFRLQGSTDNSTWVDLDIQTNQPQVQIPNTSVYYYPLNMTSYRYHRYFMNINHGSSLTDFAEIDLEEFQSTLNTFDTRLASDASGSFSASTFKVYDNVVTLISGTGKVNVTYAIDGGAFSSLVDQDTFKVLGDITYTTQFDIRLQLVDDQKFGSFVISQPSGQTMKVLSDGSVLASSGKFGLSGTIVDKSVVGADFTTIGANVDQTVDDYFGNGYIKADLKFNNGNENTDGTTPFTVTSSSLSAGYEPWKVLDGTLSSVYYTEVDTFVSNGDGTSSGDEFILVDLGTANSKLFSDFSIYIHDSTRAVIDYSLEGSVDNSTFDVLATVTGSTTSTGWKPDIGINNPSSYRYYKVRITKGVTQVSANLSIGEIRFFEGTIATTINTFDTNLASSASGTFSAGTFKAYDNVETLITGTGKVNVTYAVDGGTFQYPNVTDSMITNDADANTTPTNTIRFVDLSLYAAGDVLVSGISYISNGSVGGACSLFYYRGGTAYFLETVTSPTAVLDEVVTLPLTNPVILNGGTDKIGVAFPSGNSITIRSHSFGGPITLYYLTGYATTDVTATLSSNDGSWYFGVQTVSSDQNTFKTLGDISYTSQFDIRLQLVGDQKFSKVTIATPNTVLQLTSDGQVQVMDGGIKVSSLGKKGIVPVSLTQTKIDDMTNMDEGAIVFNETTEVHDAYNGSTWSAIRANQSVDIGTGPILSVANMTLNDDNLVVAKSANLQSFVNAVDHALLKARGTGVSSTYVSSVDVGGTTFDQPLFDGEISSDEGYFHVSYTGSTGITVENLTYPSTYVYLDNAGILRQQTTLPTRQDWSRKIFTMRIGVNTNTSQIIGFEYLSNPIGHYSSSIRDLYDYLLAQGVPFKKEQVITGRSGDLGFDVSSGTLLEFGGTGNINDPNIRYFNAVTNTSYNLMSRTQLVSTETNLVKFWDNNSVITALGSTTVVGHRLYRFSSGNFAMQYGQGNYANMTLAKAGVLLEDYVKNPVLFDATFFGWWFIESTATNTIGNTLTEFVEYTIGVQGGSSSGFFSGGGVRKHEEIIGDNSNISFTTTHNLNTRSLTYSILDNNTFEVIDAQVSFPTVNTAEFTFSQAPTTNEYSITIIG